MNSADFLIIIPRYNYHMPLCNYIYMYISGRNHGMLPIVAPAACRLEATHPTTATAVTSATGTSRMLDCTPGEARKACGSTAAHVQRATSDATTCCCDMAKGGAKTVVSDQQSRRCWRKHAGARTDGGGLNVRCMLVVQENPLHQLCGVRHARAQGGASLRLGAAHICHTRRDRHA